MRGRVPGESWKCTKYEFVYFAEFIYLVQFLKLLIATTLEPGVNISQVLLLFNGSPVQSVLMLFSFLFIIICSDLLLQLKQAFSIPVSLLHIFKYISPEIDLIFLQYYKLYHVSYVTFSIFWKINHGKV